MLKKNFFYCVFFLVFITGCATISTFQTAKTLPAGEIAMGVGMDMTGLEHTVAGVTQNTGVMKSYETWIKMGLGKKFDAGLKFFPIGRLFDVKYQFLNGKNGGLDAAVDLAYSATSIEKSDSINDYIDIYSNLIFSSDLTKLLTLYISPKHILRTVQLTDDLTDKSGTKTKSLLGSGIGIAFNLDGEKVQLMLEYNYVSSLWGEKWQHSQAGIGFSTQFQ